MLISVFSGATSKPSAGIVQGQEAVPAAQTCPRSTRVILRAVRLLQPSPVPVATFSSSAMVVQRSE